MSRNHGRRAAHRQLSTRDVVGRRPTCRVCATAKGSEKRVRTISSNRSDPFFGSFFGSVFRFHREWEPADSTAGTTLRGGKPVNGEQNIADGRPPSPPRGAGATVVCVHLCQRIGFRDCGTCEGNVRQKVFSCNHPGAQNGSELFLKIVLTQFSVRRTRHRRCGTYSRAQNRSELNGIKLSRNAARSAKRVRTIS
jgi:hypothetical protein